MNVLWFFPPSVIEGAYPNISQYRFFKYMPIRASIIYPYIASVGVALLNQSGIETECLDCPTENIDSSHAEKVVTNFDWVIMEARTPTIKNTYAWCQKLKELGVKTLLYGDHAIHFKEEARRQCNAVVNCGDYDWGCYQFFKNGSYDGVWDVSLCPDLNELPLSDRENVNWMLYYESWRHRDNFFWIMSSRGCSYDCSFCAWVRPYWNNIIRYRTAENVAQEYKALYDQWGDCEILDDADMFDMRYGVLLAQELIDLGLDDKQVLWANQTHPNMITNLEDLLLMRKSGLRTVKLGLESGNQKTLNLIRKGLRVEQSEKAIKLLQEAEIMVHANLMVGFPWETKEDAYQTISWIKKLDPNQAQFSLVIPYPWTDLYDYAKANGWIRLDDKDYDNYTAREPMLTMQGLSPEEICQLYKDCWRKFYFDPKYIWRHIKGVRHWEGVKQLWRGFKSIRYGHMEAVK